MSKPARLAANPALVTDPVLARLEKRMQSLDDLAKRRMVEVEALAKDSDAVPDMVDRFCRLSDEVIGAIAQSHKLQQVYRRRHEKLEAERAKRVSAARAAFLAPGAPPTGTRH
jgi:DNA repair ATPase RecN